jgi:ABC-2 type transport system permease protein
VIRFAPGSLPWLLAHELKLSWRTAMGKRAPVRTALVFCGLGGVAVIVCAPVALALAGKTVTLTPLLAAGLDVALLAVFSLMLSQTLSGAVLAFYTRGDLDLLLSSPISGRKVLAVRAIGLALPPFLVNAAMATPFVLPAAATGHPAWLAIYVVLAAVAMLATAAGVGLAMALFAVIGPRATRTVGQLLAAVVGASVYLTYQARNLSEDRGAGMLRQLMAFASAKRFGPGAPLAWPARALMGEPIALFIVASVAGLVFAALVAGLGRRFIADAGIGSGTDAAPRRAGRGSGRRPLHEFALQRHHAQGMATVAARSDPAVSGLAAAALSGAAGVRPLSQCRLARHGGGRAGRRRPDLRGRPVRGQSRLDRHFGGRCARADRLRADRLG